MEQGSNCSQARLGEGLQIFAHLSWDTGIHRNVPTNLTHASPLKGGSAKFSSHMIIKYLMRSENAFLSAIGEPRTFCQQNLANWRSCWALL